MSIFGELIKPLEVYKQDGMNESGTIGIHNTQIVEGAPEMVFPERVYLVYDQARENYLNAGGYVDKAKIAHTFEGLNFGEFEVQIRNAREISILNNGFEYKYSREEQRSRDGQVELWYGLD